MGNSDMNWALELCQQDTPRTSVKVLHGFQTRPGNGGQALVNVNFNGEFSLEGDTVCQFLDKHV